jgi:hypothetical protein
MQIYIAGINHFDPLCKARLQTWLISLKSTQPTEPSFVAVEWDEGNFKKVRIQRGKVRALASAHWPESTIEFLDALEAAVAFEADTHNSIMPNVETVWLDRDRSLAYAHAIEDYASDRIKIYESYIPSDSIAFDSTLLDILSQESWRRADKGNSSDVDRDTKFAHSIMRHLRLEESTWAIAIVGARHAGRNNDRMVYILEASGFNCEITELRPIPNAA